MLKAPAAEVLATNELSEEQTWMLLDPSPEAQIAWIESLLTIEDVKGQIVPFKLFPQQRSMVEGRTGRDVTVKGRQTRASSLILALNLRRMTTGTGLRCLTMTQDDQTTATFRARVKHHLRDLEQNGLKYEIELDNDDELVIGGLENRYIWGSGAEKVAARAFTGNMLHFSEFSHWPDTNARTILGAALAAVPGPPYGQFDIESTPNGAEGKFYEQVMDSNLYDPMSRWTAHFYPWWLEPRYRAGPVDGYDILYPPEKWEEILRDFQATAEEERLMEEHDLDVGRIIWRRVRKAEQDKTDAPFLQEYPETIESCFLMAGGSYFASPDGINHLEQFRPLLRPPTEVLESLTYKGGPVGFAGPNLFVWQRPQPGQPYVLWVDCAGGGMDDSSDYSAITVFHARDMMMVARLNIKAAPDEVAPMAVAIGSWYNTALLGGERDAFGLTCVNKIQMEYQYKNLWYYVDPAAPPIRVNQKWKPLDPWGHPTQIRNQILTTLRERVFQNTITIYDSLTLQQMGAFTWQKVAQKREGLKAQAKKGWNDDLVMSIAGCSYIANQATSRYSAKEHTRDSDVIIVGRGGLVTRQAPGQGRKAWLR